MKKLIATMAMILASAAVPAVAQTTPSTTTPAGTAKSQADCQANWKSADKNSDGRLDKAELDASKSLVPTSLSTNTLINEQEFISTCMGTVQGQKK